MRYALNQLAIKGLTREEQRIGIYHDGHQPIDPAQVTPDTPLEALNLNWRERERKYWTRWSVQSALSSTTRGSYRC